MGFIFFIFFFFGGVATSGYKLLFMACLIHFERMCAKNDFFLFLPLMEYCPSGLLSSASVSSASKNNCSVFVWCVRGPNQTDQCKSEWTVLNHLYTQLHNKLLKCTFMFDFFFVCFFYLKHTVKNIYRTLNLPLPY